MVRSVANLTRGDGSELLALEALRRGAIQGAGVLEILSSPAL